MLREIHGKCLREASDCEFGCAVVCEHSKGLECYDAIRRLALVLQVREKVPCSTNNLATTALLDHLSGCGSVAIEDPKDVHFKHLHGNQQSSKKQYNPVLFGRHLPLGRAAS